MTLRLRSGSVTPASLRQEALLGVDGHERDAEVVAEGRDDLLALVLAHQPVVDEHARELVADRAVHEQRRDRRVDPAAEPADDACPSPTCARMPRDLLLDDRRRRPAHVAAADVAQEALEDLLPVGRVDDLGVELDAVDAALARLERGDRRRRRRRQRGEPRRRPRTRCRGATSSTSARPAGRRAASPARGRSARERPNSPTSAPSTRPPSDSATQLHAVADAEHRDAELEQLAVQPRRALGVHRRGAAGEDQPLRPAPRDLLGADVVGQQLAEDAALAHAPRDQLRVLARRSRGRRPRRRPARDASPSAGDRAGRDACSASSVPRWPP